MIPFGAVVEYHTSSVRDKSRLRQFGKKVLLCIFAGYELIAWGIWKGDLSGCRHRGLEMMDASEILSSKNQRERSIDIRQKEDEFIFPEIHGTNKIVRKRLQFPRTHPEAGANRKERRFQQRTSWWTRRVSTDRINRWRGSPCRLLVDSRWLPSSSSQRTSSSTPCAEGLFHWNRLTWPELLTHTHIWTSHEWNILYLQNTKTTLQARVSLRWSIATWFTNLVLCFRPWRFRMHKRQWTRNGKKLQTIPAWQLEKVKCKEEVILEAPRDKKKVHFATLMNICHLKNAELEPRLQKNTKAESCSAVTL